LIKTISSDLPGSLTGFEAALALDTQTGGKTWNYYVRQLFGGKPNPDCCSAR
jgi:hypothetical protein